MSLFSPIRGVVLRYRRTCYQCCVSTCRKASLAAAKVCCSLLPETPTTTWQLPACTECSTRPARLQVGPTSAGTTYGRPVRFEPRRQAPALPN